MKQVEMHHEISKFSCDRRENSPHVLPEERFKTGRQSGPWGRETVKVENGYYT